MLKFIKKYLADILLVIASLSVAVSLIFVIKSCSSSGHLISYIYRENDLLETIDLSKENEERQFVIEGAKTPMTIAVKHNAICVLESGCPHHDCIDTGWVSNSYTPIICTYNLVKIVFNVGEDVVVG